MDVYMKMRLHNISFKKAYDELESMRTKRTDEDSIFETYPQKVGYKYGRNYKFGKGVYECGKDQK